MKVVVIYSPSCFSNLCDFFYLKNTQGNILKAGFLLNSFRNQTLCFSHEWGGLVQRSNLSQLQVHIWKFYFIFFKVFFRLNFSLFIVIASKISSKSSLELYEKKKKVIQVWNDKKLCLRKCVARSFRFFFFFGDLKKKKYYVVHFK